MRIHSSYMKTTAHLFKALSETIRLRILALLIEGERCVCDLMAVLDLPQSTVSRHLATLRNSGWIKGRRQGLWMYYRLAGAEIPVQQQTLELLRRELIALPQGKKDQEALAAYLATKDEAACQR
jgi:ArsR family transcriptional regulator, arsenate/arsenite/antimonite-responsive transcriptional repressor